MTILIRYLRMWNRRNTPREHFEIMDIWDIDYPLENVMAHYMAYFRIVECPKCESTDLHYCDNPNAEAHCGKCDYHIESLSALRDKYPKDFHWKETHN